MTYNQALDDRNVSIRFHLGGGLGNDWRNSAEAQHYKISLTWIVVVSQRLSACLMAKGVGSNPARCWALPLSLLCSCAHVEH